MLIRALTIQSLVLLVLSFVGGAYAAGAPQEISFTVSGFKVTGDNPIGDSAAQSILKSFTGKHSGLEGLQAASDALQSELRKRGYSFHRVVLPPQTLTSGVVELQVVEFDLGQINIEGNKFFNNENVLNALPVVKRGKAPNVRQLSRALRVANTNASRQVRLAFSESEESQAINASVKVQDRNPSAFFTTLQNSGSEDTGEYRLSLGYQYNNLFNKDHSISVVYTGSPDAEETVSQVGFNYSIPFYNIASSFSLAYSDSDVQTGTVEDFFQISGAGSVLGLRFQHAFVDLGSYQHDVVFAYDDKLFENDLQFFDTSITGGGVSDVRTNPFALTYRGRWVYPQSQFGFELTTVSNQPGGSDSDETAYTNARDGASPDWAATRYGFNYIYRFRSNWAIRFNYLAQNSGEPLVPGEQFGLGGAQSVRGFEERQILGDDGWQNNLEVFTPNWGNSGVNFLFFYDAGHVEASDSIEEFDVSSAGAGVRWAWQQRLGLRADLASVLEGAGDVEDGDSTLHFAFFYRF